MASSRNLVSTIGALASPQWGTEPGVRKGKRSLLASHTRCICSMETTHNLVKVKLGIKVIVNKFYIIVTSLLLSSFRVIVNYQTNSKVLRYCQKSVFSPYEGLYMMILGKGFKYMCTLLLRYAMRVYMNGLMAELIGRTNTMIQA